MPHIHQNPGEHDLTASAFIVDTSGEEPRLWLHEHKSLGMWLQFGGHVELDENPWQAVAREVGEESGFALSQMRLLQPKLRITGLETSKLIPQPFLVNTHPIGDDHFHTDLSFAFTTGQGPANERAADESASVKLFSLSEIREASTDQLSPNVRNISLFVLESLLHEWEAVDPNEFNR